MSLPKIRNLKRTLYRIDKSKHMKGRLRLLRRAASYKEFKEILRLVKKPIFIGGCGRSGTTLLLSLLSAHRDILCIPYETYSFSSFGREKRRNIYRLQNSILDLNVDYSKHKLLCEKTPKNVTNYGGIIEYFGGEVKILNIVRDARDVVTSIHPENEKKYWVDIDRWVQDVKKGKMYEGSNSVLTLKYESMVYDHVSFMREVCNFLNIKFDKGDFERYPETSSFNESRAWHGEARPVSDSSVGRWKEKRHKSRIKEVMANEKAVSLLKEYNYLN